VNLSPETLFLFYQVAHQDQQVNQIQQEQMAKRAEMQNAGLMSADYNISAPLVVGEDIFMEEMDNDNESEWSLEIK
jgi:hypothetical protein